MYEFKLTDYDVNNSSIVFNWRKKGDRLWNKSVGRPSALLKHEIKENPALLSNTYTSKVNSPSKDHCPFKMVQFLTKDGEDKGTVIQVVNEYRSYQNHLGVWINKYLPRNKYFRLVTLTVK